MEAVTDRPCHVATVTEGLFKIAIWFGREASEPNRDLNGSGDTPPPHAQWINHSLTAS